MLQEHHVCDPSERRRGRERWCRVTQRCSARQVRGSHRHGHGGEHDLAVRCEDRGAVGELEAWVPGQVVDRGPPGGGDHLGVGLQLRGGVLDRTAIQGDGGDDQILIGLERVRSAAERDAVLQGHQDHRFVRLERRGGVLDRTAVQSDGGEHKILVGLERCGGKD